MRIEAGLVIGDRYRLLSLVGAGPFGSLWRAADRIPGKQVAIRIIGDLKLGAAALDAFRREMVAATAVHHPSLARIYAAGSDSHGAWVARELVDGHPLATLLEREVLSPSEALDIVAELAGALAEIHALGLAHGAVSPRTVLVRRAKNDVFKPRLIGLGRAQLLRSTEPAYSSPEALAAAHYSGPSDIWSLGVILFRCLNGRLPFGARTAAAMEVETRRMNRVLHMIDDPRIRLLVAECFALHPDARPIAAEVARRARTLAREIERERARRAAKPTDPPVALTVPPPLPKRLVLAPVVTPASEPVEIELLESDLVEPEVVVAPAPSRPVLAASVAEGAEPAVDFRPKRSHAIWIVLGLAAAVIFAERIIVTRAPAAAVPVAAQAAIEPLQIPQPPPAVTPTAEAVTTEVAASASAAAPSAKTDAKAVPRSVVSPRKKADSENPYE
jgi:serine/threonine-protein kinase